MKMIEFAGKFVAAIAASVILLFVISLAVDTLYAPSGTSAGQSADKPVAVVQQPGNKTPAPETKPAAKQAVKTASAPPAAAAASTAAPAASGKKKRHPGRKVYLRKGACAACHGRKGQRAISYYPSIAGQDKKYMIQQIRDIMSGKRVGGTDEATGHPRTQAMHGALVAADGSLRITKEDIVQMADWLTNLPPAKPKAPETPIPAENIATGKKLFKKCISCHGKEGKKPLKGYPYVAGQKREYLLMQLMDIRDRVRTNGKTKVMLPFVKKLSNEQMAMIADYLSQIDRSKK